MKVKVRVMIERERWMGRSGEELGLYIGRRQLARRREELMRSLSIEQSLTETEMPD